MMPPAVQQVQRILLGSIGAALQPALLGSLVRLGGAGGLAERTKSTSCNSSLRP